MKCQFVKANKDQCRCHAVSGDSFCFNHSEKTKNQKLNAVRKGGYAMKFKPSIMTSPIPLRTGADILGLLEDIVGGLKVGPITPQKANSLVSIAGLALKVQETSQGVKEPMTVFDLLKEKLHKDKVKEQALI